MAGRTIASGEDFTGDDEGGGVGAKVLEEVGHAVEEDEGTLVAVVHHCVVSKAHAAEYDREEGEAHILDWLATPLYERSEG